MKVFISWSGERSKAIAEALHNWLPLVLHYVTPWLSQADIEAGQRWAEQVAKELEGCNFGILCVTKENVASPWVLFEAGALAKSMQESRVIPLLLDLEFRDITGPLAQFQAKKFDKVGFSEAVFSLNQNSQHPVPDDRVRQLFDALWPDLESKINNIPKISNTTKLSRSQPEILEELVSSVRTLEARFREIADEGPRGIKSRKRRMHPMMFREMRHMLGEKRGDPITLLMFSSLFKEEAPWLYELGLEAYRVSQNGDREAGIAARNRFQKALRLLGEGPFMLEEFGGDSKMSFMMMRELDRYLEEEGEIFSQDSKPTQEPEGAAPRAVKREA